MLTKFFKQSSEERLKMITEGNILRTFFILSLPGILMVLIQSAMPIIDSLFVYNYDNAVSGAAISYSSSMQNIFVMGLQGFSVACSAIIGQTNGAGELDKARKLAGQLIASTFIGAVLVIPIIIGVGIVMTSSFADEIKSKILIYNGIVTLCIPLIASQSAFNSIKNVFGHPEITFLRALLFVPIKLTFTYVYVVILKMGIIGAALSGLCAYSIISIFIVYDLFLKKSQERLLLSDLKIGKSIIKKFWKHSWASVVLSSTKALSFYLMKIETASYGEVALSAQSASGDVNNMFSSFTACFDAAVISAVSINVGSNKGERAKKYAYLAIKVGLVSSIIMFILSITLGNNIIGLYTTKPEILEIAQKGNMILAFGLVGFSVLFNEMPALIGLGLNKASLFIQTMRIWVIRMAALYALYFFVKDIGIYAVFLSLTIANTLGGILSHIVFVRIKWKKHF